MRASKGKNVIVSWKTRKRESVSNVPSIFLWRVHVFENSPLKDKNNWSSELAWFKSFTTKHGLFQKVKMKIKDKEVVKVISWLKPFVIIFPTIKSIFLPLFKYLSTLLTWKEKNIPQNGCFCSLHILCSFTFLILHGFVFIVPPAGPCCLLMCTMVSGSVVCWVLPLLSLNVFHRFRDI